MKRLFLKRFLIQQILKFDNDNLQKVFIDFYCLLKIETKIFNKTQEKLFATNIDM